MVQPDMSTCPREVTRGNFHNAGFRDFIRTSISEKYDFSTKITTQMQLAVTSQSNCVVIYVANWIGNL
jgi:hypothetical protein